MFTIKEALGNYIKGCEGKVKFTITDLMIKAMLAGMMIAFGAAGSSVAAHAIPNVGVARLVAGCVFPVGLMMVILTGAELFTGDCMMAMGCYEKRFSVAKLVKVLVLVYVGNLIGSVALAAGIYYSGQLNYSAGLLGAYTIKVALGKCTLSFGTALVSGILCNILVCAAVLLAACAKDVIGKLFSAFFVIMLFVTCGFEHCVANMYYIPAGLMAKLNPDYVAVAIEQYGLDAAAIEKLNLYNFFITNQIPVTIGNILGGMVFVGLALWYVNRDK